MSADGQIEAQSDRQVADGSGPLRLEGARLAVARAAWLIIALASAGLFIAGVPLRYRELLVPCVEESCAYGQLAPEAMIALQDAGLSPEAYAAFDVALATILALVYGLVALVIFWRQSRERMALLASLWLITFGVTFGGHELLAVAGTNSWLQPLVSFWDFLGAGVFLVLFLLVFPDGRFVPHWTRWAVLIPLVMFLINFIAPELFSPSIYVNFEAILPALWFGMILLGIGVQFYRYLRVSGPIERQQTKWVMFGMLVVALGIITVFMRDLLSLPFNQPGLITAADFVIETTMGTFVFLVIPLTIGFSILRYRLWDTDIIINRTLVYGLLTIVLALLYFSSVVLIQQITQALTGQRSPLAIIASTLLIAALFSPLRRRLQDLIDRRFYRRKYDASQTLSRFAQVTQEEVDLEHLTAELLAAVQQTMQPERVSLWLVEQERQQSEE